MKAMPPLSSWEGYPVKLKYAFEYMDLDDEIVAVPIGNEVDSFQGVIKLNESAALIMKLLQNECTEDSLLEALTKEYDGSREVLASAIKRCISKLQSNGLLAF